MKVQVGSNRQKNIDFILDNLYITVNDYGTYVSVYLGTSKKCFNSKYFYNLFPVFGCYANDKNQRFFYIEDDFLKYGPVIINSIVKQPAQIQYLSSYYSYIYEYDFNYDLTELKQWILKNCLGNEVFSDIKRENEYNTVKPKVEYLKQKDVKIGGIYSTKTSNVLYLGKCPVSDKYCYVEVRDYHFLSDLEKFLKQHMKQWYAYSFVETKRRLLPCKNKDIKSAYPNLFVQIPDNVWQIIGQWMDLEQE